MLARVNHHPEEGILASDWAVGWTPTAHDHFPFPRGTKDDATGRDNSGGVCGGKDELQSD